MKSPIAKRSVSIKGHFTSVSLEDAFWQGLQEIAASRGLTMRDLIRIIDSERKRGNLSSAIRLFVLSHYRGQAKRSKTD
jgi:predicted DNA-binding ribbon-helix-helix protein